MFVSNVQLLRPSPDPSAILRVLQLTQHPVSPQQQQQQQQEQQQQQQQSEQTQQPTPAVSKSQQKRLAKQQQQQQQKKQKLLQQQQQQQTVFTVDQTADMLSYTAEQVTKMLSLLAANEEVLNLALHITYALILHSPHPTMHIHVALTLHVQPTTG